MQSVSVFHNAVETTQAKLVVFLNFVREENFRQWKND